MKSEPKVKEAATEITQKPSAKSPSLTVGLNVRKAKSGLKAPLNVDLFPPERVTQAKSIQKIERFAAHMRKSCSPAPDLMVTSSRRVKDGELEGKKEGRVLRLEVDKENNLITAAKMRSPHRAPPSW